VRENKPGGVRDGGRGNRDAISEFSLKILNIDGNLRFPVEERRIECKLRERKSNLFAGISYFLLFVPRR